MRVLFWGTPDFAIPSLEVVAQEHLPVGVVTQPDRPAGRGRTVRAGPVKNLAASLGLPVLQPDRARGDEFLGRVRALDPEISVVAAYGQILPAEVLEAPARGSINVHASLLPELRGAAPVNWAIIRGHEATGVTIMRMVREMDAGPILVQRPIEIGPDRTAGELYSEAASVGAVALRDALREIEAGTAVAREQDHAKATFAPKLEKSDARLDWSLSAEEVARWIRGCDPWPGAWSELNGARVLLYGPSLEPVAGSTAPGRVLEADPRAGLLVAAGTGAVRVNEVKPAGRARMTAGAWVSGRGIAADDRLE